MIPLPPKLENLRTGTILYSGLGTSTVLPDLDFETYSPAGYVWDSTQLKWRPPHGSIQKGLPVIGAAKYAEHEQTEVLSCAYNLKNGDGAKLWTPNDPPPVDLFNLIKNGGLIEAWNCSFEHWIWNKVCVPKYGWPPLCISQLRCAMAKARAFALPGNLDKTGEVLNIKNKKDKRGTSLIDKFCKPRNPTKHNPLLRNLPKLNDPDTQALYEYNLRDIEAEAELSSLIPDLSDAELAFWQCDQIINYRGVQIDTDAIKNCIKIIEQAYQKYNTELQKLTNNEVKAASEVQKLVKWINKQGIRIIALDADVVDILLARDDLPFSVRGVLEIRSYISSAAVKKLYAMSNRVTKDGRLHDLFIYHAARTGRAAGAGPQPQNLPNKGPAVSKCSTCNHYSSINLFCGWCAKIINPENLKLEWNHHTVEDALTVIKTGSLECVEYHFNNAIDIVSGCLRGLFIAGRHHDLLCSDYSAIEAVVLAALSGEQWRLDVFNTHGKIYEMSASKISGVPFEEFEKYVKEHNRHHPLRKKIGKVAELASGYQGWITAWRQFGADEFFTEDEMKQAILAWRKASPAIVEMWGGQERNRKKELYGLEGAAITAVLNPGQETNYRGITYLFKNHILYCRLLSGRYLVYHQPTLTPSTRRIGQLQLSFSGWNTNPKNGAIGWVRISTYGGRLTENIVQATARDILANAIVNLEQANYKVVLHIHDEIVAEVPENTGSLEEFEAIMSTMPTWANGWPIYARNGWRGKRYRK